MYLPNSKWTWSFAIVALIQACIILAFESYVFGHFQIHLQESNDPNSTSSNSARTIPTFLTLYIFGFLYQLLLVWDALRMKNTIQIIGLVMYNVGLLIYGAVQMEQIKDAINDLREDDVVHDSMWADTRPFLLAIPCILALGTVCMSFIAWKLNDEFAWTIYKRISADLRMKRRYLYYQVYIALLKFDFFFFLGFTVQFVVIVTRQQNTEFYLTIAAIPVTILILLAAAWFVRKENLWGTIAVLILYFGGLAYFIFKLVRMYSAAREKAYAPARKELSTFAVLTIILILLTIVLACICAHNYGKGLKPYITKTRPIEDDEKPMGSAYAPYATEMAPGVSAGKMSHAGPSQGRMEID